jgi:hypothetical protein
MNCSPKKIARSSNKEIIKKMAQMRKTPRGQSPLGPGRFIGTNEAEKAKEAKRIKEGKPTYSGKPARNKAGASTVAAVAKRFGVTAREARDIATAVGTLGKAAVVTAQFPGMNKGVAKSAAKNLVKQVKETGTAAKSGKKGTTSSKAVTTSYDKRIGKLAPATAKIAKGTKRK